MTKETEDLIRAAKLHRFTAAEKEEHRRSSRTETPRLRTPASRAS